MSVQILSILSQNTNYKFGFNALKCGVLCCTSVQVAHEPVICSSLLLVIAKINMNEHQKSVTEQLTEMYLM